MSAQQRRARSSARTSTASTSASTASAATGAAGAGLAAAGAGAGMAALTAAHILAKERLMAAIAAIVTAAWRGLPHYDRAQIPEFQRAVLPAAAAANRQSVLLTGAFLARATGTQPEGMNVQQILDGIRNGTAPAEVYQRPFITVWAGLARGIGWDQAVKLGLERAVSAAETDVQLAFTHTLRAVGQQSDRIVGYKRVPDPGACEFCRVAATLRYRSPDLLPLHNRCRCGVEPLVGSERHLFSGNPDNDLDIPGPDGLTVGVRQHGELGPVLVNAADRFTTSGELAHAH